MDIDYVNNTLTEEFIEKHSDKVDWYCISIHQKLSETFIEKHSSKVDWDWISIHQKLSEAFIDKHSDKVDWGCISANQKLSEAFIEKHSDKVDWGYISECQKLSEAFIEKHSNNVSWYYISSYQKLSEEFIEKYSDKVDWDRISRYQKLSEAFIKKHNLSIPESSWMYKSKEDKEKYIKENTDYEIKDSKLIAYKSCRSDGYSKYNFQYKYEVGKEYECHADFNLNENNSFGLSAWTKEGALRYCKQKLLLVEIDIEDVACIVHEGNKIRCTKLKVLKECV